MHRVAVKINIVTAIYRLIIRYKKVVHVEIVSFLSEDI